MGQDQTEVPFESPPGARRRDDAPADEERASKRHSAFLLWLDRRRFVLLGLLAAAVVAGCLFFSLVFRREWLPAADTEALLELARLYTLHERYDQAIEVYERLLEGTRGAAFVRAYYANTFFKKGDFAKAEAQYRWLLDELELADGAVVSGLIDREGADYRVTFPTGEQRLYRAGKVKEFRHGVSPMPLFNMAQALHRQGKTEEAKAEFNVVIREYEKDFPNLAERAREVLRMREEGR
ncbi:MAG: tetratricopeptide repeat protein [Kiritimatiellae bacterium]|nr:tetratricopeptide repeat protein [Kiritimatiellia bacterium]